MQSWLTNLLQILLYLVVIPIILGSGLVLINRNSKQLTVNLFGFNAQIIGGFLGIIIHEFSHLIMAVIFGHKITGFRPVRIPAKNDPTDQSLGYVKHNWNQRNFYQQSGNLLIGIAPIIGNTLAILGLTDWLLPQVILTWQSYFTAHTFLDVSLLSAAPFGVWSLLLWVILLSNICVGGFDLSRSDLDSATLGIIGALVVIVFFSGVITIFSFSLDAFQSLMVTIYVSMAFAIAVSLVTNIIIRLIARFKHPRVRPRHLG